MEVGSNCPACAGLLTRVLFLAALLFFVLDVEEAGLLLLFLEEVRFSMILDIEDSCGWQWK